MPEFRGPPSGLHLLSDAQLTELARDGSPAAFEAIVVRHRRALVRHCTEMLGEYDAEDAVQEALVRANDALNRHEEVRVLAPWLHTIAHHVALNQLRKRPPSSLFPAAHDEQTVALDESAMQRQELREVLDAVQSLPDRQRQAIVMLTLEGRSYVEIGARLGATPRAVGQLLNRGRRSLYDNLPAIYARL